ncbi:DUF6327 family protein [Maribacter sp. ACAM166]|uniref:DUF6327 family protein n=1 Tax=Maribacter sp. ACAM166 TaxID=2508996 RepID=UPI001BB0DE8E|nr:DUF6327 family protein [Maribacter sp. ACAM166]
MENRYSSFKEVDERLKVLKLRREIDTESFKLHLNRTKANFYPTQLLGGTKGILQKMLLTFAVKKLSNVSGVLRNFRRSEPEQLLE